MKRNTKVLVHAAKLQAERDKRFDGRQNKMMDILLDVQASLHRLSTQFDMRKKVLIDQYFPIKRDSDLINFLNKLDGQFIIRREEFENYIYCSVTNTLKLKRPFENSFIAAVFSRDYIKTHKWPSPG